MALLIFYIFTFICVCSALVVIMAGNPIHSAMGLISAFLSLAAIYVLMHAEFIAAIQVLVYAGAMMVLILFAIFLVNLEQNEFEIKWHLQTPLSYCLGIALFVEVALVTAGYFFEGSKGDFSPEKIANMGGTELLGEALFSKFLLPFELISVLLLAALVGATVLAKKEKV